MANNIAAVGEAVRQRLYNWAVASFDTDRLGFPGQPPLSQPVLDDQDPAGTMWLRLTDRIADADQLAIGTHGKRRYVGVAIVEIFTPAGVGDGLARTTADSIANFFRNQTDASGALLYREPSPRMAAVQEAGEFRLFLDIPYWYQFDPEEAILEVGYPVITITQAAHGFASGDAVTNNTATWAKAIATADATLADGLVVSTPNADTAHIFTASAPVTVALHGLGTAGQELYLSQSTPGALTTTKPVSGLVQRVATVIDANTLRTHDDVGEYR